MIHRPDRSRMSAHGCGTWNEFEDRPCSAGGLPEPPSDPKRELLCNTPVILLGGDDKHKRKPVLRAGRLGSLAGPSFLPGRSWERVRQGVRVPMPSSEEFR